MTGAERPGGIPGRLLTGLRENDVSGLPAEMAYRFLFAVFPFGLFVAAMGSVVAGWLRVEDPAARIVAALGDKLPAEIANVLRPELERLLTTARTDLLLLGAVAALWAATGGMNALTKGIHRAYGVGEQRPFPLRYAIAAGLTILAAAGTIAGFVTIVGGALLTQEVADAVGLEAQAYTILRLLRWPAVFAVLVLAVAIIYRYGSSVVVPWRWIIAGAVVFATGRLLATAVLAFYVLNVADYGATYGSLGWVVILMLWLYVTRRSEEVAAAQAVEEAASEATDTAWRTVGEVVD